MVAGGNLALDLHMTLDGAKAATDAAAKANAQITQAASAALSPSVKMMLQQISIKAVGPEVAVKATVPESEVLGLFSLFGP